MATKPKARSRDRKATERRLRPIMPSLVPMTADGIHAALDRVAQAVGAPPGAPRFKQMALIPTAATADGDPGVIRTGEPGRPKGATNKRTDEWADYLLQRYPSPLIALAEAYGRPLIELAREIAAAAGVANLTVGELIELLRVQQAAAIALAPYLHSKQPLAIEGGGGLVQLLFQVSPELGRMARARQADAGAVILDAKDVTPKTAETSQFSEAQPQQLEKRELENDEERPADAG